jgi:hypothetical protein
MINKQLDLVCSDDYAILDSGRYYFYYGYEEEIDDEWCFVVKENNKILLKITTSEIERKIDGFRLNSTQDYLLSGIGIWLLSQ